MNQGCILPCQCSSMLNPLSKLLYFQYIEETKKEKEMQKPRCAVRSRRASLWWRAVYIKEPSTHSHHRLRTKNGKRKKNRQFPRTSPPSPSLWERLFFFPSFSKCFEPPESYRPVKACKPPKAPKLTFDTVLYTFTNKPNRCYWSSRSSSETKIIALSQPQDNPNPLTILPGSQLHWCPLQPSLGRFDYGGGCQEWGGALPLNGNPPIVPFLSA